MPLILNLLNTQMARLKESTVKSSYLDALVLACPISPTWRNASFFGWTSSQRKRILRKSRWFLRILWKWCTQSFGQSQSFQSPKNIKNHKTYAIFTFLKHLNKEIIFSPEMLNSHNYGSLIFHIVEIRILSKEHILAITFTSLLSRCHQILPHASLLYLLLVLQVCLPEPNLSLTPQPGLST